MKKKEHEYWIINIYVIPVDPLDSSDEAVWRCDVCMKEAKLEAIHKLVSYFLEKVKHPQVSNSVEALEDMLEKATKLLHPNHYVVTLIRVMMNNAYILLTDRMFGMFFSIFQHGLRTQALNCLFSLDWLILVSGSFIQKFKKGRLRPFFGKKFDLQILVLNCQQKAKQFRSWIQRPSCISVFKTHNLFVQGSDTRFRATFLLFKKLENSVYINSIRDIFQNRIWISQRVNSAIIWSMHLKHENRSDGRNFK